MDTLSPVQAQQVSDTAKQWLAKREAETLDALAAADTPDAAWRLSIALAEARTLTTDLAKAAREASRKAKP